MNNGLSCPIPISNYPYILLAHGGGGKLMQRLIEDMFLTTFGPQENIHDSTVLSSKGKNIAFTTDSYVVHPLFFPGGDIGTLAVNGTVNDLSMSGARPLYLSLGFILEEGTPMETLWRVVQSIKWASDNANVKIVTGDTKVVDKGKGDGIYINTSGIGILEHNNMIVPSTIQSGDSIILNGDLGRHGITIMAVREGLAFESSIATDCAPLNGLVQTMLDNGIDIHCMRDLTRGGLASALNEIAQSAHIGITIDESSIPVQNDVAGACEMLGLDPLYVANEGRFVSFVPQKDTDKTIKIMRSHKMGTDAQIIGTVNTDPDSLVTLKSKIGAHRILDMISGEQLPRIC